ncbi:inorganic pyrophosphatase [Galendromus occidentalis]|uniref:Inorganic pyrophosphatase n=1 Tax=Galendromus occidentalis TaxID=34638 RepID=A0AAJ7L4Y6_9ACAR|nr:inorganic pyrophosphatase [Galendromus occidentalis]
MFRRGLSSCLQTVRSSAALTRARVVCKVKTTSKRSFPVTYRNFASMPKYSIVERGTENTPSYRLFIQDESGQALSPFHDIPLFADSDKKIYNMVVEVPRWSNAKMEIATGEPLNPIKQDTKNNKLRFVKNPFPHHGYIWNYGAIPQTWEDPGKVDHNTNCKGDNDPIDVCEIGHRVANRGDVIQVKALGILALIDEGETDWKVIAIDVLDPLASKLNNIQDVEQHCPGLLKATVEWFKIYKIPDGKPANQFAFDGEVKDRDFAESIIKETHSYWTDLIAKPDPKINCAAVRVPGPSGISPEEASSIVESSPIYVPNPVSDSLVDKWYYLNDKLELV